MGILQKLFRRGGDEADNESAAQPETERDPAPSVLDEDQERARQLLEQELEAKKSGGSSQGAPE